MTTAGRKWSIAAATAIVAIFAILCISNAFHFSPTYDEPRYLAVGERIASGQAWREELAAPGPSELFKNYSARDRVGDFVHAPLSFYTHGILLKPFTFTTEQDRLHWARVTMLVYAVGMAALIYLWSSSLFGAWGGIVSLSLYCFNSNVLAHSSLITTDIIYACFSLFLLYFFWRYLTDGKKRWLVASGASLGLALLSKYSAALWFFLLPALAIALRIADFSRKRERVKGKFLIRELMRLVFAMAVILLVAAFVLNLGYGFRGSFMPLGANHYQSHFLAWLSGNTLTSRLLALVPYPFLRGFESQKYITEVGHPSFLAGMNSTKGWWYYYFACFALKMPAMFWPLMILACIQMFRDRERSRRKAESILILSSAAMLLVYSFLSHSCIGFRFLLSSVIPLFVVAGAATMNVSKPWTKGTLAALVFFYALPALLIHPHHIAYFSELVGGPKNGYKWLSDSNLDWGQDLDLARKYVRESDVPVTVNPGMMPVSGRILINATTLQDCFSTYKIHEWLLPFKPVDYVGYSWLVFDIDGKSVAARVHGPDSLPDDYYFGSFEYARDHLRNAERFAKSALASRPDLPEALYLLGLSQMGLGKLDEAAESFSAVPSSHPFYVGSRSYLSLIAALQGEDDASKAFWKQTMTEETLRDYAKRPTLDVDRCSELSSADPGNWKYHNNLGVSLWANGRLSEAEKELKTAFRVQPHFVAALSNLAVVLEEEGHFEEAIEALRKYKTDSLLLRTEPFSDYRVYYQNSVVMMGDTLEIHPTADEHVLELKAHLAGNPEDVLALNQLVVALMRVGRFAEAYRNLNRAITISPANSVLYTNLAVLYTEKKMFSQALSACERALALDSHSSTAAVLLASLRAKSADLTDEKDGNTRKQ